MQNAKDTFYEVLRDRLAALNPERTVVVRGVTRPGLLVVENELARAQVPAGCFALRWAGVRFDMRSALPVVTMACEISYATLGTSELGGMDRGRALAGMDAELLAALTASPQNAAKKSYSGDEVTGLTAVALATRLWWGEAVPGEAKAVGERMERSVTLPVMSLQEAGEL